MKKVMMMVVAMIAMTMQAQHFTIHKQKINRIE